MNGEKIKDPTADLAISRVMQEEKAYRIFGVHLGDRVRLKIRGEDGKNVRKQEAVVTQFHPKLYWVRVEYIKDGRSECFIPVQWQEVYQNDIRGAVFGSK